MNHQEEKKKSLKIKCIWWNLFLLLWREKGIRNSLGQYDIFWAVQYLRGKSSQAYSINEKHIDKKRVEYCEANRQPIIINCYGSIIKHGTLWERRGQRWRIVGMEKTRALSREYNNNRFLSQLIPCLLQRSGKSSN